MTNTQKASYDEIKSIISAGYPNNTDKLQNLVYYLSNQNSYGYEDVIHYLKSLGDSIIPHIKNALSLRDEGEMQTSILFVIVKDWQDEWVSQIQDELIELAWYGNENWDVDLQAIEILAHHKLISDNELTELVQRKVNSNKDRRSRLEKLRK